MSSSIDEVVIDDIIERCRKQYGLVVIDKGTKPNKSEFVDFNVRHLETHPDYDLNHGYRGQHKYRNLMRNILFLFSIMNGQTTVIAGYQGHGEEKRMQSVMDLYLLRPSELGYDTGGDIELSKIRRTDAKLLSLLTSITGQHRNNHFPNWSTLINELGMDERVFEHLTQDKEKVRAYEKETGITITDRITNEMVKKCPSPTPMTYGHGGYRWDKKNRA